MTLADTRLRSLKPQEMAFQVADGGGLFVEVTLGEKVVWRMRYRLNGRHGGRDTPLTRSGGALGN